MICAENYINIGLFLDSVVGIYTVSKLRGTCFFHLTLATIKTL